MSITSTELAIFLLVLSTMFGLVIHLNILWHFRIISSALMAVMIGAGTGFLIVSNFHWLTISFVVLIQAYRLFSYLRVVKGRLPQPALKRRSFRSEYNLSFCAIFVLSIDYFIDIDRYSVLFIMTTIQFIFSVIFLRNIFKSSSETVIPEIKKHTPDINLPSVTVAIPARNETLELTDCLQSILKSNYPKLEILVLDDCSQDNTSDIIKGFAHKGVRFLEGTIPRGSWLAKNHAYQQLLDESEGSLILFCGVDVRFEYDSIRRTVESLLFNKSKMISVLPTRNNLHGVHNILQPMRYWREMVFPRFFKKHPVVLSTFWMADRDFLESCGGFSAFKASIKPEKHFAKRAEKINAYDFLRSSAGLGISSIKSYKSQLNTAIRTRYPEHQRQPENIFFYSVWFVVVFVAPFFTAIYSLYSGLLLPTILSILSCLLLTFTHFQLDYATNGLRNYAKIILFPFSVISEIITINYSMWAYEFSEVNWKGRNICMPVLKVVPKLPKI